MKCKTGNDRWLGQTGENKEQSNSTSGALDGGHGAAGCDCGVTDCGLQRKLREMMVRGCALVGQEFPLDLFSSVK